MDSEDAIAWDGVVSADASLAKAVQHMEDKIIVGVQSAHAQGYTRLERRAD